MTFNELNSVEDFIIHNLTGVNSNNVRAGMPSVRRRIDTDNEMSSFAGNSIARGGKIIIRKPGHENYLLEETRHDTSS